MENSNNNIKIIGALLLGTAIGGILGVLFAPEKGSDTRKKILAQGDDLTDSIKEKFNSFIEEIKKEASSVKDKAHDLTGNGSPKIDKINIH